MFLDFIQSDKKKRNIQYDYGNTQVRMPQIILLIGEYEDREIVLLENSLKKHFPVEDYLFWISIGKANLPKPYSEQQGENKKERFANAHLKQFEIAAIAQDLPRIREKYTHVLENKELIAFLEGTVADIFNATSGLTCERPGSVYVSVIGKADQFQSGMIAPVIKVLKKFFKEQFSQVYMDLYMLLNQAAFIDGKVEKEATIYSSLCETEEMMKNKILRFAYVLSNYNSNKTLLEIENELREQYASIALMISLKTLFSNNLGYRYIDEEFGKGIANKALEHGCEIGWFSSLGHMHLNIDEEFIIIATYLAIWRKLAAESKKDSLEEIRHKLESEMGKRYIEGLFSAEIKKVNINELDFQAIVRNKNLDEQSIYTMAGRSAINKFWGKNLELYYNLNVQKSNIEKVANDWKNRLEQKINYISEEYEIFDIVNILEDFSDSISKLYEEANELVADKEKKISEWEGQNVSVISNSKKKDTLLWELAKMYINKKNELYIARQKKTLYEEIVKKVGDLNAYYKKYKNYVCSTAESLEKVLEGKENAAMQPKNGLGKLQITNSKEYYMNKTIKILEENQNKVFQKMSADIKILISKRNMQENKLNQLIYNYCEKYILTEQYFYMNFFEELQERLIGYQENGKWDIQNKTDVSNFLLTTIVDTQHILLYDQIRQGVQVYEEMCLFLQDDSIFMEGRDHAAHTANIIREQKMKLFCDKRSLESDVLFISGNIKAQNIYKWSNYEKSYKEIMEKK